MVKSIRKLAVHEDDGIREPDICGVAIELINPETSWPKYMSIATILMQAGESSEKHYHNKTEEVYYIIEGNAVIEVGSEQINVKPGHAVLIPIGETHRITNTSTKELKFLSIDSPIFDSQDVFVVDN